MTVTLQATGTGTMNWTQTEFDTSSNITLLGQHLNVVVLGYPFAGPVPSGPLTPPPLPLLSPPPTLATASVAAKAAVAALVPNAGPPAGGTVVMIHGAGLANPTSVSFGGTPATSFTSVTPDSVRAVAPAGTGTVDVTVTTPVGTSEVTPGDQFTYTNGPIVTDVQPRTGPPAGGATVAISGLQLTGATGVSFGGTPAKSFTVNSDTSITAVAPPEPGWSTSPSPGPTAPRRRA